MAEKKEEEGPRAFARTLELIDDGNCHVELSKAQLYRPDLTLDAAIKGACAKVVELTKLPLLYGTPE